MSHRRQTSEVFPGGRPGRARRAAIVLGVGTMALGGGCRSVQLWDRPAGAGGRSGPAPALVFDGEAVRASRRPLDAGLDALHPEFARNDAATGVRTPGARLNDRLYRGSEWYRPPAHAPLGLLLDARPHGRRRHGDLTIPLLSPARERSFAVPR